MTTTIGLIRHGLTDWNAQQRMQGQTDIPLNKLGREQAEAIAARLAEEEWDVIVASDLSRAYDTAEAIAKAKGKKVDIVDPRLRELNLGQLEGMTKDERTAKWGDTYNEQELGVEDRTHVADRGEQAIDDVAARYPGQKILMVSHGGLIRTTLTRLVPESVQDGPMGNTSLTILHKKEAGWDCKLYNCTSHLSSLR
ncbi:histidine phosphatase family protein [Paenibacillus sp. N1-5-1-14]|uniref:histidine phosphatase family protein n=1 Tax=Paenibacillus radicibacter TaxID=2972488 RepID=UPI002159AB4D|nr:histidine phosphatase family protein [Paenibacillus radicibacter]MCR8642607.1 histidine phosphatase family protein [Paenibacillus radicibacter]